MSVTKVAELQAVMDLDDKKFKSGLNSSESRLKSFGKNLNSGMKDLGATVIKTFAVMGAAAIGFGVMSVKAYNESVEAGTKLETNLLAVKGNTLANVKSLDKLAAKLQQVGVIEDDVIKAGMSQLATFNLQGKTIEKLTPKIADMVAQLKGHNATAEDMVGINNLIGKVMTGNIGALGRYGVTLSENQKEQMKNANETERANILIKVLAQNYGKVNEALAKTPQGQITKLKNNLGDLMEVVGQAITGKFGFIIETINTFIERMGGVEGLMAKLQSTFELFKTGNFTKEMGKVLGVTEDSKFVDTVLVLRENLPIIAGMIGGILVAAIWSLTAALLANPIVWIGVALVAVGAAIGLLIKRMGGFTEAWKKVSAAMTNVKNVMLQVWAVVGPILIPIFNMLWKSLQETWKTIKQLWEENKEQLIPVLKLLGGILAAIVIVQLGILIGIIIVVVKVTEWLVKAFRAVWNWLKNLYMKTVAFGIGFMLGSKMAIDWVKNLWNNVKNFINKIIDKFKQVKDSIKNAFSGLSNIGSSAKGFLGKIGIPGFANGVTNFGGGMALVGEKGPELVNLPRGSSVIPNDQIGANVTINVNMTGIAATSKYEFRELGKQFINAVNEELRAKGKAQIGV